MEFDFPDCVKHKIIRPKDLKKKCDQLRTCHTIATLNGSFDLLHAGHMHMIYEAKKQADILIVALNSDESIRQYKSKDRPIIPLRERIIMMGSLYFVDYVTWFEETTPLNILEVICPNVHVNGSEYGRDCLEAPLIAKLGGKVHVVDLIPGLSTSNIVKKIKTVCV